MEILTPLQSDCLKCLFADEWFRRHFYLTGGTALAAFYLHHRESDDLDFFCHAVDLKPIPSLLESLGRTLGTKVEAMQKSPGFMRYQVEDTLKLDVVEDTAFRVGIPELIGSFMVDNLKNIAVNKVCAILGRLDAKDYVDLYFILTRDRSHSWDIFELLELGQKKDTGLEPFVWASLIADVKKLTALPRMLESFSLNEMQDFFLELRDKILDRIKPKPKKR